MKFVCRMSLQTKNRWKSFARCSYKRKMDRNRLHDAPANEKWAEIVCTVFLQTKNGVKNVYKVLLQTKYE